jgi:membrane fusion protein, macrolide-specific efflux system
MRIKKFGLVFMSLAILAAIGLWYAHKNRNASSVEVLKEAVPVVGTIRISISCTGTVLPKNRLEVRPPVNGRVDSILVQEGMRVKTGEILAWMSSTDRAALLDAARGKGEEALKYWQETYKPIPLLAPIDGEVIVATTQPGQTITTAEAVVVLSDHLIVRAQVDETDIGKIATGMKAVISLDAYPDTKIRSFVEHIYYESKTVNNVTIYEVDLIPEEIPPFFRSGMNASVDFIVQEKDNILVIPVEAVVKQNGEDYVLLRQDNGKDPVPVRVELGVSDDKKVEVISGMSEKDRLIIRSKKYVLPKSTTGTNPFMPPRRR